MANSPPVIVARDLQKKFGKVEALRGLSLEVGEGSILCLLGPNGAGKTTLVRILATLIRPDAGTATVAGNDVTKGAARVRRIIGLAGQNVAVDEHLTGRENLVFIARLNHLSNAEATQRAQRLLEQVDLLEAADRPAKGYSGGMRRRLDLAASLIGDPKVIFLDEPTTGLDPPGRLALWAMIDGLRRQGKTILLTTQNLEEADRLADRIAVVDKGTIIAEGSADELKTRVGGDVVEVSLRDAALVGAAEKALRPLKAKTDRQRLTVPAPHGARTLAEVVKRLDKSVLAAAEVSLRRPTLDDVFLALTGHATDGKEEKP